MTLLYDTWNKNYSKCPTCSSSFLKENGKILYVQLRKKDGKLTDKSKYLYCSDNCINVKLDTVGIGLQPVERLNIISRKIIMGSHHVVCEPSLFIVEIK